MNIKLQDMTAVLNGTSRYGLNYDTVHVETLLVTDSPIPSNLNWYLPSGVSIPPEVSNFFKATDVSTLPMYPMTEEQILKGTEDIAAQAKAENLKEVMNDAGRYLLRAVMKKTPLQNLPGSPNTYLITYDYKVYPAPDKSFEFKFILPFPGIPLAPNGGKVQASVITPIGARIDAAGTKGKDQNGQEISEIVYDIPNTGRKAVSFTYKLDPEFVIKYIY